MKVTLLHEPPNGGLAVELNEFERQFRYPLDQGWFRIDHGDDYNRFYRSLGESVYVIARDDSGILGVCSAARRELHRPGRPNQATLYLGDLKIAVRARGGLTLLRLANAVRTNFSDVSCAYCVVMNGTIRTPDKYTGRAGLPGFEPVGELRIWRLPTALSTMQRGVAMRVSPAVGEALFRHLSEDQHFSLGGDPQGRSNLPVQWWIAKDERACGRLEDTRRAKQLFRDDGEEMVSAHLAAFAYSTPESANAILDAARESAASAGIPALFLARHDSRDVLPAALEQLAEGAIASRATIYATGVGERSRWNLFTSEI
jgi:hypothetical protein